MKYLYCLILASIIGLVSCSQPPAPPVPVAIIPKPLVQQVEEGTFELSKQTNFTTSASFNDIGDYFKEVLNIFYGISIEKDIYPASINIIKDTAQTHDEGYTLTVTPSEINIRAKTSKGAFYGVQSLLQLFPPVQKKKSSLAVQAVTIRDAPRFSYRGMHLDVGRHFFPVDFIKKYIDLMAQLKMNTFHWHLTEDQGWRIEIKKYPKLQEIAAFRDETLVGHYNDQPVRYDGKPYGGYYTQEEIKDVVQYAQKRQITIIPEIEMPGHSQAAIAAYPDLGCTGEPVSVATTWGIFEEVYCPKEETFKFLEGVIDEVAELFPGKYIHIGGDEAPKTRWKNCKHCQLLIKNEGLKDEHELQSYFIARMERYINAKGKQIIGWDEILEGGLAPNATVMSWRGTRGAVIAAKQQHDVILTPGSHCYFDHYQSEAHNEPLAIGGFLPLEKVYSFEPIPKELTEKEASFVLGAQGNVWTEYMPTISKVEYMVFPRMIALSEVVWSSPAGRSYEEFVPRLEQYFKRLDALDVRYANHLYEISGSYKQENDQYYYQLKSASQNSHIYYSTDGSFPTIPYTSPIEINKSLTIRAISRDEKGIDVSTSFEQFINFHKGVGATIKINKEPHPSYNAGGIKALINGIYGDNKRYGDKEWLGFSGEDLEIELLFDNPIDIHSFQTRFHNGNGQWIYAPEKIELSFNEEPFMSIQISSNELLANVKMVVDKKNITSLRIKVPNYGKIPDGKQGAGNKAWTFIDELIID